MPVKNQERLIKYFSEIERIMSALELKLHQYKQAVRENQVLIFSKTADRDPIKQATVLAWFWEHAGLIKTQYLDKASAVLTNLEKLCLEAMKDAELRSWNVSQLEEGKKVEQLTTTDSISVLKPKEILTDVIKRQQGSLIRRFSKDTEMEEAEPEKKYHPYEQDGRYGEGHYRGFVFIPQIDPDGEITGYTIRSMAEKGADTPREVFDNPRDAADWVNDYLDRKKEGIELEMNTKREDLEEPRPEATSWTYKCRKCGNVFDIPIPRTTTEDSVVDRSEVVCTSCGSRDVKIHDPKASVELEKFIAQCNECGLVWKADTRDIKFGTLDCPKCKGSDVEPLVTLENEGDVSEGIIQGVKDELECTHLRQVSKRAELEDANPWAIEDIREGVLKDLDKLKSTLNQWQNQDQWIMTEAERLLYKEALDAIYAARQAIRFGDDPGQAISVVVRLMDSVSGAGHAPAGQRIVRWFGGTDQWFHVHGLKFADYVPGL